MSKATVDEDAPLNVPLTSAEYMALEQMAHGTSREIRQYAQWLLRLALARRLRLVPADADELELLYPPTSA
jgi:hypothetical protein